jgi:hypothetical protein
LGGGRWQQGLYISRAAVSYAYRVTLLLAERSEHARWQLHTLFLPIPTHVYMHVLLKVWRQCGRTEVLPDLRDRDKLDQVAVLA